MSTGGFKVPPAKSNQQYEHFFITCERDPKADIEQGKKKLLDFLVASFGSDNIEKSCVVAEEGGKTEYKHYHALVKLHRKARWSNINKKMKKYMTFTKANGKGISTWFGRGRNGDVNIYEDWKTYLQRPGIKCKQIDQNQPLEFVQCPKVVAWNKNFLKPNGSIRFGTPPVEVEGELVDVFYYM